MRCCARCHTMEETLAQMLASATRVQQGLHYGHAEARAALRVPPRRHSTVKARPSCKMHAQHHRAQGCCSQCEHRSSIEHRSSTGHKAAGERFASHDGVADAGRDRCMKSMHDKSISPAHPESEAGAHLCWILGGRGTAERIQLCAATTATAPFCLEPRPQSTDALKGCLYK